MATSFFKFILKVKRMKFFSKENASKQALEQSILAVVTIDEKNNITFYNGAAQELWGYAPSEVLGKNIKMRPLRQQEPEKWGEGLQWLLTKLERWRATLNHHQMKLITL